MIQIKDSTVKTKSPLMHILLEVNDEFYQLGLPCIVTSMNDGTHMPTSKHYKDEAIDFRIFHVLQRDQAGLIERIKQRLGAGYDIILEGPAATSNTTGPHIHVEYDPK